MREIITFDLLLKKFTINRKMVDYSSISLRPPKNWQDFERSCSILFASVFNDPFTQLNGRAGQSQHGVDVYGRINGNNERWFGIQCKGKEENYGGQVTERELIDEVEKARNFKPPLSEFILATTAPNDARLQEIARNITQKNISSGSSMAVHVWGWEELQNRICQYPDAIRAFSPDGTPFIDEIKNGIDEVRTDTVTIKAGIAQLLARETQGLAIRDTVDASTEASETIDSYLHSEIDGYRDLIQNGRSQTAINLLEGLKKRCWENASSRVRFRIITNIGAAKLRLGDENGAATDFITAAEYDPTDKIGMANIALAHLIRGNIPAAIKTAEAALLQNPTNEDAASYLIQAHSGDMSITDPLAFVPEELRDTPSVKIGLISFYRRRRNHEWRKIARESVSLFPDSEVLKRAAAEADLDAALEARWYLLGERTLGDIDISKIREVANILESSWNNIKNSEEACIDTTLPSNLAIAYRTFGNYALSARVLDEALVKKPDDIDLLRLRAVIHLTSGKEDEALTLLQEKCGKDPESAIIIAEILISHDPAAARKALDYADQAGVGDDHRLSVSMLRVESYLSENKMDTALKFARDLVEKHPERIEGLITLFHIQQQNGDASTDETLTQAKGLLSNSSSFYDRFIIARALNKQERYDEVVEILDGIVDYSRNTPALQLFLSAMLNGDRRQQTHELIKVLPADVAAQPFYLRIQAAVHFNRGDYPAAEKAISHYLQIYPEDLSMRLRWFNVRIRRGGEADVMNFLQGDVEKLKGNHSDRMHLAMFLENYGFSERALRLGYEIFLRNRDNPQIHLQYIALLLRPNRKDDMNLELLEVTTDAVFTIENKRGERDTYLIEPDEHLRVSGHAIVISPDHLVAKKAIGLRVNDLFLIDETKVPLEEWRVISIKHKWLDALHTSMERFERQFPTFEGLEKVPIDLKLPDPFRHLQSRVKSRHDAIQGAFDQYEQVPIPLAILQHSFGGDVIQIWQSLTGSNRGFRVCIGTLMERNAAFSAIALNQQKGCVVDALTLFIIRRSGIEDAVTAICGAIGITESSVDVFRRRIAEIRAHIGNPFMIVSYRDGQYFREEITDERLQQALKIFEDDLSWIEQCCEILPAEGVCDLPTKMREISRKIGRDLFDSILAADGADRLLLCEDYAYRMLGAELVGSRSSWLQPVLMVARDQNMITIEKFNDTTIHMIEAGFRFISLDAHVLLRASRYEEDPDGRKFSQVAEALGAPDAEIASHIRVAANFFNELWKDYETPIRHKAQTGKILECLMRGRGKQSRKIVEALMLQVSSQNNGFQQYLFEWLKGHFFLPFK